MSNIDARHASTCKFLIQCVGKDRVVIHEDSYAFRMKALRSRQLTYVFISLTERQLECFNVLVQAGVFVPPTSTASAILNEDAAHLFLQELRDVCWQ